jgi:uncharacterized membrane protein
MSSQDLSTALSPRSFAIRFGIILLATIGFFALFVGTRGLAVVGGMIAHSRIHMPNLGLIAEAPLAIRIHLATVVAALVLATVQMVGPKGRTFHRVLGWTLAILLVTTAVAALFIRNPLGGFFNPFQVFVVWTLIAVPWGVLAARSHNVRRHARLMTGMYFGGLVVAGALTFLPGRLMWRVFFG